jgi:hypothetical protein
MFDTFDPRLKSIAEHALAFCRTRYGPNGLKVEEGIAAQIAWRPTFFLRPSRIHILAFEVADLLFPEPLKGAAYEIGNFDRPISVIQVCSLTAYQTDPKQGRVNMLRKHGFGILTVDDDGNTTLQHPAIPLAQHISVDELDRALSDLTPALKVHFKGAYDTYVTNVGQGVQQAGQIVEALIASIATQALKKGVITPAEAGGALADVIDTLYPKPAFQNHRAALGAARDFIKGFRNIASHAQRTAAEAMEKMRKCRAGFLTGIAVATKLRLAMQQMGYVIKVHIT